MIRVSWRDMFCVIVVVVVVIIIIVGDGGDFNFLIVVV